MSSILNNEKATCSGEFGSSVLQSKKGGSSVISGKDSILFPVALAHPAHLVWGFMLREAEWTKLHINTSVANLAFVSEGSLSDDLTQQNINVLLKV